MAQSRLTKLNQQLKRVLSEAMQAYPGRNPQLMVSVVLVEVAADISVAHVWLSLLGDKLAIEKFLADLEVNKRFFAEYLHQHFEAKRQPRLVFHNSQSIAKLQDIA